MKKLLCVLMFGMVFGQVSQRVIDVTIESVSTTNLGEIFPEYDLEWAILNIISCSIFENQGIDNEEYCSLSYVPFDSGISTHSLSHVDGYTFFDADANSSFFADNNSNFLVTFGYPGTHTMQLLVTAEFPEEDTGYIEEGFDYCLHTGANLVSSPCREEVAISDAIPSEITDNLTGIITEGGAASNINGNWVGSLNGLGGGKGYWFVSNMEGCFNYTCAEN